MAQKSLTAESAIGDWQAESLRLTAFPRETEQQQEPGAWAELIKTDPETRQSRPLEGSLLEAGPYEGGWLTLEATPVRVDWRLSVKLERDRLPDKLSTLGRFDETREKFKALMKRWLKTTPRLNRLAFGAALLMPVKDRVDGYRRLSGFLPKLEIDPEGSTELLYRINRRRMSRSGKQGLEINRLSTWAVISVGHILLQISPGGSQISERGEKLNACRLEVDINTAPELRGGLSKTALPKLFQELVDLATEIAKEGDVP